MNPSQPHLIGIAGPSGAGKSALANSLERTLDATLYQLDSYYRDLQHLSYEQRAKQNFDHPDALESELIVEHLTALVSGESIEQPVYDFAQHARTHTRTVRARDHVIIEGLHTLHWEGVRSLLRTAVYVTLDEDVCFDRRLARDVAERGRTEESVHQQWHQTVQPMAEQFIYPTREFADLILIGDDPTAQMVMAVVGHARAEHPKSSGASI